jgi:heme exporter protein C
MAKQWWKLLSALLVLFSLVLGFHAPLAPGIVSVSPDVLSYGATSVTIQGYNTKFKSGESSLQVWLLNSDLIYCPYELVVIDETHIRASFSIADEIGDSFFDLYVNSESDGTIFLPAAFIQSGVDVSLSPVRPEPCLKPLAAAETGAFNYPNQSILNETIRNLLFHVPGWFAMIFLMLISLVFSLRYLSGNKLIDDLSAANAAHVGLAFAFIGLATGSLWARYTWGAWWVSDPRLNGAAISVLIYLAYFVLRSSVSDEEKAARLGAVYNIFAFFMMILFVMVLPRLTDSLHPGVGGNPAFGKYDLDNNLRVVFYPAVIGWIGMGMWIFQIRARISKLKLNKILR